MLTMIATGKKLDWDGWFLGIMGAIISGGAGAVGSGFGSMLVDPEHFNVMQGGFKHMAVLMGATFVFSAVVSLAKFLQASPVPGIVDKSGGIPNPQPPTGQLK
jgi:hypothetical protein